MKTWKVKYKGDFYWCFIFWEHTTTFSTPSMEILSWETFIWKWRKKVFFLWGNVTFGFGKDDDDHVYCSRWRWRWGGMIMVMMTTMVMVMMLGVALSETFVINFSSFRQTMLPNVRHKTSLHLILLGFLLPHFFFKLRYCALLWMKCDASSVHACESW